MKNELDKLSEITVTDYEQPHYPDFNPEYDAELKVKNIQLIELTKKNKIQEIILVIAFVIIIPCLSGLLINDSLKVCAVEKTESITMGK